jgi:hypothetical protein
VLFDFVSSACVDSEVTFLCEFRPDGKKKAFVQLTQGYNAADVLHRGNNSSSG